MSFRYQRQQFRPRDQMGHCDPSVILTHGIPPIPPLVPIPLPWIYLTLNGTYDGEVVQSSIDVTPINGPTFVQGSLTGCQASRIVSTDQSYLLFNPNDFDSGSNPDYTSFCHINLQSDFCWQLSSIKSDTNIQMESYLQTGGSNVLYSTMLSNPPLVDCSGGSGAGVIQNIWYDVGYVWDRSAGCTQYLDGVAHGTVDISPLATTVIPDAGTTITIGSRVSTLTSIYKSATFAEWVLWRQTFTALEMDTLHQLRLLNISLKTYLGL